MIQSQYQNLAGLTSLGQASAAGQAGFGQQYGSKHRLTCTGSMGQAQAGAALGQGQAWGNVLSMRRCRLAGMASGAGQWAYPSF